MAKFWNRSFEQTRQPVLTPEEARQGEISDRVLIIDHMTLILVASLALALIAFAVVYAAYA